jgi:hypothetical protein
MLYVLSAQIVSQHRRCQIFVPILPCCSLAGLSTNATTTDLLTGSGKKSMLKTGAAWKMGPVMSLNVNHTDKNPLKLRSQVSTKLTTVQPGSHDDTTASGIYPSTGSPNFCNLSHALLDSKHHHITVIICCSSHLTSALNWSWRVG